MNIARRLMIFAFILGLFGVSVPASVAQDDASTDSGDKIGRICMVLNIGTVNDGTFNEVAYQGLLNIRRDYGLTEADTIYLESKGEEDWMPNIQKCLDEGFGVIITVGFQLAEVTAQAVVDNPDIFFIGVDHFVADGPANYVGIQFRDDEAGFLVGYLAGLVTEGNTIGGIYGPRIPVIMRFRHGFENGAALAAAETGKNITVLGRYLNGFANVEEGQLYADELVTRGADVIFGAAGLTGSSGILQAAAQGVHVIGVDQDEYYTSFDGGEVEGSANLISSALKRVDVGVYDMVSALLVGDMDSFLGGQNYVLSLENGGISFAPAHESGISDEVFDQVIEVGGQLASGELSTGVIPATGNQETFSDPSVVVMTWLDAVYQNVDPQTVTGLACESFAADFDLNAGAAAAYIALNPRIEGMACAFDAESRTVSCGGEVISLASDSAGTETLGTYTVAQENGDWKVCGVE